MAKYIPLNDDLIEYVQSVNTPLPAAHILDRLRAETAELEYGGMQITPEQAAFFSFLIKTSGARRVLEIGVFTGYSTLVAALALPADGQIVAVDKSRKYTDIGRRYWEEAGVDHKIDLRIGLAVDVLADIAKDSTEWFDYTFIDADRENVDAYYEYALSMTRHGGVIVIDNALRKGQVIDDDMEDDARYVHALNQKLHTDSRVEASVITLSDGVMLVRRR